MYLKIQNQNHIYYNNQFHNFDSGNKIPLFTILNTSKTDPESYNFWVLRNDRKGSVSLLGKSNTQNIARYTYVTPYILKEWCCLTKPFTETLVNVFINVVNGTSRISSTSFLFNFA